MSNNKKRNKIAEDYKKLYKTLEGYVDIELVEDIKILVDSYAGGKHNQDIDDFLFWVASFLSNEDKKLLLSRNPTGGVQHKKRTPDMGGIGNILSKILGSIPGVGVEVIDVGKGDGYLILEGKPAVTKRMEEIGEIETLTNMRTQGEEAAFMFSKEGKFYAISQYKCEDCDDLHLKLWIVDDENSNKGKKIIADLKEKYKSAVTSA